MTTSDDMDHSSSRPPYAWLAEIGTGVRNPSTLRIAMIVHTGYIMVAMSVHTGYMIAMLLCTLVLIAIIVHTGYDCNDCAHWLWLQ